MPHQHEPSSKKLTRNWNELLQELRVVQTGVQILTGFLLTVPFSSRWTDLTDLQVRLYLAVLSGAVLTTALVVAPVAYHRMLFRQHRRPWLVRMANRTSRLGLAMVALTSAGVVLLVFDVALGLMPGVVAFAVTLAFFAVLWSGPPLTAKAHPEQTRDDDP
jgi:hypothetical protein